MPAALMTGPQRSISDLSSRASSADVEPTFDVDIEEFDEVIVTGSVRPLFLIQRQIMIRNTQRQHRHRQIRRVFKPVEAFFGGHGAVWLMLSTG